MRDFLNLQCWQKGHHLTLEVYHITRSFPKEEMYGITAQMRRSSSAIPTNIAEGCGRNSVNDLRHFLFIAASSAAELHYQIILCEGLSYINQEIFEALVQETIIVRKMIYSLCKS